MKGLPCVIISLGRITTCKGEVREAGSREVIAIGSRKNDRRMLRRRVRIAVSEARVRGGCPAQRGYHVGSAVELDL
jgi:hypothetical protein